ncbi:hypothetical protein CVT24_013134, partial [Panaeolus cyanescens]
ANSSTANNQNAPLFYHRPNSSSVPGPDNTTEDGQTGTNRCGTALNQTSDCQNAYINSVSDFCLWAPPDPGPNSVIGNTERIEVAWCLKNGTGSRLIPDGTITGAHFVQTPDFVQVTGTLVTKVERGGILLMLLITGNPIGGLVFTTAFGKLEQIHEWTNFMSDSMFCFRACKPGPMAPTFCQHIYDVMGCEWNMPANYDPGFETCKADSGEPMGVYGGSTFFQGQPATPPAHPPPASSSCTPFSTIGNGFLVAGTSIGLPTPTTNTPSGSSGAGSGSSPTVPSGSNTSSPSSAGRSSSLDLWEMTALSTMCGLFAFLGGASQFLPSTAPVTWREGQTGVNQCGTANTPTSKCQNAYRKPARIIKQVQYFNGLDDFCLWGPPQPGADSTIGNMERVLVSWCTKNGTGTRMIPEGAIRGAHFVQTPDFVQVTGIGNMTMINIPLNDAGPMGIYGTSTFYQGSPQTPLAHPRPSISSCSALGTTAVAAGPIPTPLSNLNPSNTTGTDQNMGTHNSTSKGLASVTMNGAGASSGPRPVATGAVTHPGGFPGPNTLPNTSVNAASSLSRHAGIVVLFSVVFIVVGGLEV